LFYVTFVFNVGAPTSKNKNNIKQIATSTSSTYKSAIIIINNGNIKDKNNYRIKPKPHKKQRRHHRQHQKHHHHKKQQQQEHTSSSK